MSLDARLPLVLLSFVPAVHTLPAQGKPQAEDVLIEKHVAALCAMVAASSRSKG